MVCKRVAFLRAQDDRDVPSQLSRRFFGPRAERRFVSRFADQVLPVDASARPRPDDFAAMARELLAAYRGKTWRLWYEPFRGGWNTISREDALAACKETLTGDRMSVSEPDVTVLCT